MPQDDVLLSRDLRDQGYEQSELDRMTRRGELVRIRRGAYGTPGDDEGADARLNHLRLLKATVRQCSPDVVVSHMSAAAVHDLPLWTERLERVQLTRDQSGGSKKRRYVELHGLRLPAADVVTVSGLRVTSLARTILDLSCALPMREAVAVGDAALRRGVTQQELLGQLELATRRTGIATARRTIAFLDRRSESPGESVSRVDLHSIGMPPTELQYDVFDEFGTFVGRSDFAWPGYKTLGEYDGRGKYGELRRPEQSFADVLWDEKEREDRLRDLGWQIVRWIWADLQKLPQLQRRLERAFRRGSRTR